MRYAVWNNKGGVGKSFLTFVLATEYAARNDDTDVYVVDMCPQANVSEMLLGGDVQGRSALSTLLQGASPRQTIGGYFDTRIAQPHSSTGNETSFPIQVHKHNALIPANLYLIAGDPALEVQAEAINQIASQSLPQNSWENVHSWLADLCAAIESKSKDPVFFIDCNPSFAAYTELSIVAADDLIIPCSADGSSARAIDNIGQLVYGHGVPPQYQGAMFSSRLQQASIPAPSIKLVIFNRSTQYNSKASAAFGAMFDDIKARVLNLVSQISGVTPSSNKLFVDFPDTHSVTIVASHEGRPIRSITVGRYKVFGKNPQVNAAPLSRYQTAIDTAVQLL